MNKGDKYYILNHGYVEYIGHIGDDLTPVESARLSTNTQTNIDKQKDDNLRDRLAYDNHTSVFESNYLILRLRLPMFVLRQFERHRTIDELDIEIISNDDKWRKYHSRNEFSARYSVMPNEHYFPIPDDINKQSSINKQGSEEGFSKKKKEEIIDKINKHIVDSQHLYQEFIGDDLARETARIILDDSKYVTIQYSANLLNWAYMLSLRLKSGVQPQTFMYAEKIAFILKQIWPDSYSSLEEHMIYAEKYSRSEHELVRSLLKELNDNYSQINPCSISLSENICIQLGERAGKRFMKKVGLNG